MLDQKISDPHSHIGGVKSALLLLDVIALLNFGDNGGIGAGPADAFLFQRLDQRRLVVTRRRLREVLRGA